MIDDSLPRNGQKGRHSDRLGSVPVISLRHQLVGMDSCACFFGEILEPLCHKKQQELKPRNRPSGEDPVLYSGL